MNMPVGPDGVNVMAAMARIREKRRRGEEQQPAYLDILETSNKLAALKTLLKFEEFIINRGTNVDLRLFEGDTDEMRIDNVYTEIRRAIKARKDICEKLTLLTNVPTGSGGGSASGGDSS